LTTLGPYTLLTQLAGVANVQALALVVVAINEYVGVTG